MTRVAIFLPAAANSWSTDEIRKLREFAVAGLQVRQIALALQRTESAVRNKATMHGLSLSRAQRNAADKPTSPQHATAAASTGETQTEP